MSSISTLSRSVALALLVAWAGACGSTDDYWSYDPYYDPWYETDYGTYTIVRRPVVVVDGWTTRTFRSRPYHGWAVRRHNSPVIVHTASHGDQTIEVHLTPRDDATHVEVKARSGANGWNKQQAKAVLGQILEESKADQH